MGHTEEASQSLLPEESQSESSEETQSIEESDEESYGHEAIDLLNKGKIVHLSKGQEITYGAHSKPLNLLNTPNTNNNEENPIYVFLGRFGIDRTEFISLFRFIIISFLVVNISCLWCFKCIQRNRTFKYDKSKFQIMVM